MSIYYVPINLERFNLLKRRVDEVEDFTYKEGMKVGDCLLLYVSKRGLEELKRKKPEEYELCTIRESGFYGMARVVSLPYQSPYREDFLKKRKVIDAKITHFSKDKPMIPFTVPSSIQYKDPQEVRLDVLGL